MWARSFSHEPLEDRRYLDRPCTRIKGCSTSLNPQPARRRSRPQLPSPKAATATSYSVPGFRVPERAPPLFVRAVRADIHVVPSVPRLFSVSAERNSYPFNSVLNVPSVPNWLESYVISRTLRFCR